MDEVKSDFLLSFELSEDSSQLDIHFDDAGLSQLLAVLSQLKDGENHEHLMTPSWGGNELSEDKQSESSKLLNKITLHKWKQSKCTAAAPEPKY